MKGARAAPGAARAVTVETPIRPTVDALLAVWSELAAAAAALDGAFNPQRSLRLDRAILAIEAFHP